MAKGSPGAAWEKFAAREPWFAVLTDPRFLRVNRTESSEREFFATGEALVDWIFDVIERRLSRNFSAVSTLEYGCGVGRLAIPLSRRPGSVTAVDHSPVMLDAARREAARLGAPDIHFCTPDALFASGRKFDLVTCVQVLQRMPASQGLPLLQTLVDSIASGGVGVFQFPIRTSTTAPIRASRWLRHHMPLANALANRLRGKPVDEPFVPAHIYDLDRVMQVLDDASVSAVYTVFERQPELSSVMVFAEKALPSITGVDQRGRALPGTALPVLDPDAEPPIDVRSLIAAASLDDLNAAAEKYFSSLTGWEDHLAKPFSKPADAPRLLVNLATLLHGLQVKPGTTVLEFGAGTGWLSRCLTQLGCRVILLDVSATALQIARELYERVPIVGDRPAPRFLQFDGRTIDLPDASVERVLTFDAFHHVPNPDDVLREFGRVLTPGGIAGFSEPGARHSKSPMSQFEMRAYRVVENDIDVHGLWRTARQCGFRDMQIAVFPGPPFYVSLAGFEDFLAAGQTADRWLTATRVFQRDTRNFFLFKDGEERRDSRSVTGLACALHAAAGTITVRSGEPIVIDAIVSNVGASEWLPAGAPYGGVQLGAHLYDAEGVLLNFELGATPITDPPRPIAPGERVTVRLTVPPQPAGRYRIELDCVASDVTWFAQIGSTPATVLVEVLGDRQFTEGPPGR
jgi:SAM-dependent methyltransferase